MIDRLGRRSHPSAVVSAINCIKPDLPTQQISKSFRNTSLLQQGTYAKAPQYSSSLITLLVQRCRPEGLTSDLIGEPVHRSTQFVRPAPSLVESLLAIRLRLIPRWEYRLDLLHLVTRYKIERPKNIFISFFFCLTSRLGCSYVVVVAVVAETRRKWIVWVVGELQ